MGFTYKMADYYSKCITGVVGSDNFPKWDDVKTTKPCKELEAYVNYNFQGAWSAEELWAEQEHLGRHRNNFMVCFHAMSKSKQYIIPLDTHWTHSNVATFGLDDDDQHCRQAAASFLETMLQAVQTYQASTSVHKKMGPFGFHSIGGHMGVFFTHLRLQGDHPPCVVTIDQALEVLRTEAEVIEQDEKSTSRTSTQQCNMSDAKKFQVKLSGQFKDYDRVEDKIVKRAYLAGFPNAKYSLRGQKYSVDFAKKQQTNLGSGKSRDIRPPH